MQKETLKNTKVCDLVSKNGVYAYALYHLGINFYEYSEQTLQQVCINKGLSIVQLEKELESPAERFQTADIPLTSCPIDLIIEYLRHSHIIFVKHKLPYIASLIESCSGQTNADKTAIRDLKIAFPLFLEDFIHHIHEEEDKLFHYIKVLDKADKGTLNPLWLHYMMENNALQKYAIDHKMHDDEIKGFRNITDNYSMYKGIPLHIKVIYNELMAFEKSIEKHAWIENEILFPKALLLEKQIRKKIHKETNGD